MTFGAHGTMKVGGKTVKVGAWTIAPPEPPPVSAYDRPEWLAFLRAILAEPGEDVHRLVAADWLEEHGEPERAEFIRASVGEEKLTHAAGAGGCRRCKLERVVCRWIERAGKRVVANLLGCDASTMWYGRRVIVYRPESNAFATRFARGFIEHITCTAADWLAHADSLVWRPEQTVECPTCRGRQCWKHAGPNGQPKCAACGNSSQNGTPHGSPELRRCASCKRIWEPHPAEDCVKGRAARPFVPTAQPITKVTLTTVPRVEYEMDRSIGLAGDPQDKFWWPKEVEAKAAEMGLADDATNLGWAGVAFAGVGMRTWQERTTALALLSLRWPRITFGLPGIIPGT